MGRVHAWQIIPPEAELSDRRQPREEDAEFLNQREAGRGNKGEDDRQQNESRHLEHVEETAPAENDAREAGERSEERRVGKGGRARWWTQQAEDGIRDA